MPLKISRLTLSVPANITIDGRLIAYTVKTSRIARHSRLEIRADSGLCVIIPTGVSSSEVKQIIESKKRWVLSKLAQFENTRRMMKEKHDSILFLGEWLRIEAVAGQDGASVTGDLLRVGFSGVMDAKASAAKWLKQRGNLMLKEMAISLSQRTGLKPSKIRISSARTRWGSCSKDGTISLNWKLIMMRPGAIEYAIIHELCHIKELNHSPAFWNLVSTHCFDWRAQRKWLRANEIVLTRDL